MGKKHEIIGNLDAEYWVQKSDPLALMKSVPFSLGELKILDTYISKINISDDTCRTVIFTKEEYEELMGITFANPRALEKYTENMLGKVVKLKIKGKGYLQFVLFTKAYYHLDEYGKPVIELTCTEEAKNLFFCIGKYHYFKYALENVINLTHKASYLLYLYVRMNNFRKNWTVSVEELRDDILDCKEQESYKEYKIFKNRVFDPAVKEVNAKTDCHFSYEAIKRGRRVAEIQFKMITIIEERQTTQRPALPYSDLSREVDYGSELCNLIGNEACRNEFSVPEVIAIKNLVIKIIPYEDNLERCNYVIDKITYMNSYDINNRIKNRFRYLIRALENDLEELQ